MLFIMVLLVWHYATTWAGVGKTVAGEERKMYFRWRRESNHYSWVVQPVRIIPTVLSGASISACYYAISSVVQVVILTEIFINQNSEWIPLILRISSQHTHWFHYPDNERWAWWDSLFMYVCVCVCVCVCVYIYIYIYTHTHIYTKFLTFFAFLTPSCYPEHMILKHLSII